jgi:hypothetical protein
MLLEPSRIALLTSGMLAAGVIWGRAEAPVDRICRAGGSVQKPELIIVHDFAVSTAGAGVSEIFLADIESDAGRTAKEVAKKIPKVYVEQGWLAD